MTSSGSAEFWKQVEGAVTENEEVFGPVKKTNKKPEQTGLWWDTVGMDGYVKSVQSLLAQIQREKARGSSELLIPQPEISFDPWPKELQATLTPFDVLLEIRGGGFIAAGHEREEYKSRNIMRTWSPDNAKAILEQLQIVAITLETRANEREARSRALVEEHAKQTASINWLKGQVAGQRLADLEG